MGEAEGGDRLLQLRCRAEVVLVHEQLHPAPGPEHAQRGVRRPLTVDAGRRVSGRSEVDLAPEGAERRLALHHHAPARRSAEVPEERHRPLRQEVGQRAREHVGGVEALHAVVQLREHRRGDDARRGARRRREASAGAVTTVASPCPARASPSTSARLTAEPMPKAKQLASSRRWRTRRKAPASTAT